jgi:glycosyltransferase involved in cell wall biosynthesis
MNPLISVIIPTHNPNKIRLNRTLDGLRKQSLSDRNWELIIIDNASPDSQYIPSFDLSWHKSARIIIENQLGLTRARVSGIKASQGNYIVFVDDDNVLEENYLENTVNIFRDNPNLGSIGGKSLPEFEVEPDGWVKDFWVCLALRDLGEEVQTYFYSQSSSHEKQHPLFAPIGAGMALQREAAKIYVDSLVKDSVRMALDRTGKSLQSGGDCDINLTLLDSDWGVGYFPQLKLTHLISAPRLTKDYLANLNHASSRSWVQVLDAHNIRPWRKISKWGVWVRKIKAVATYQPWDSPSSYIQWRGACGTFEGLSTLI